MESYNIKDFEEKVLVSGLLNFLLPVSVIHVEGSIIMNYDSSGYISLKEIGGLKLKDGLEILEKTLLNIRKTQEFLIEPERITLNSESIYVNPKTNAVKFVFIPKDEEAVIIGVLKFIKELQGYLIQENKGFLEKIYEDIKTSNMSPDSMITLIGLKKREVFECGIIN